MTESTKEVRRGLEAKIPPPILALLVAIAMGIAGHWLPKVAVADWLRYLLVGAGGAFGLGIAVLGFRAFGRAKTTINPVNLEEASTLVTGGVYRFTRNPMYVGLSAALVTLAVWLAVPWLLLAPAAFVLFMTRFQIVPEERVMRLKFGKEYEEYCGRVRRWL